MVSAAGIEKGLANVLTTADWLCLTVVRDRAPVRGSEAGTGEAPSEYRT